MLHSLLGAFLVLSALSEEVESSLVEAFETNLAGVVRAHHLAIVGSIHGILELQFTSADITTTAILVITSLANRAHTVNQNFWHVDKRGIDLGAFFRQSALCEHLFQECCQLGLESVGYFGMDAVVEGHLKNSHGCASIICSCLSSILLHFI